MKSVKVEDGYIVRLFKGEEIIKTLADFCASQRISAGNISGIGGASDTTLGYYNLETKQYQWKTFEKIHELVSLNGNISVVEDKPFLHLHAVISDENFDTFGGHLKEATVGATCEVFVKHTTTPLTRQMDDEIGLKLLELKD